MTFILSSCMTSPVSVRTTFGIQQAGSVSGKNGCVLSRLIELRSFPQSKIDVNPIYCVLMFFSTSDMIGALEEVARKNNIVLFSRINKIAS